MSETLQTMPFQPNEGKNLVIKTDDGEFERYPGQKSRHQDR